MRIETGRILAKLPKWLDTWIRHMLPAGVGERKSRSDER